MRTTAVGRSHPAGRVDVPGASGRDQPVDERPRAAPRPRGRRAGRVAEHAGRAHRPHPLGAQPRQQGADRRRSRRPTARSPQDPLWFHVQHQRRLGAAGVGVAARDAAREPGDVPALGPQQRDGGPAARRGCRRARSRPGPGRPSGRPTGRTRPAARSAPRCRARSCRGSPRAHRSRRRPGPARAGRRPATRPPPPRRRRRPPCPCRAAGGGRAARPTPSGTTSTGASGSSGQTEPASEVTAAE